MTITVELDYPYSQRVGAGKIVIDQPAGTLRQLVDILESRHPGFRGDVCSGDGKRFRSSVLIDVDGHAVNGLDQPLPANAVVWFSRFEVGG